MQNLPEDVSLDLLRGLGAYLRAAPTVQLPVAVRRYQRFRDAALAQHREAILGLLDDEAQRGLILQWLDRDKPSLRKDDKELLRIAAERSDGWEDALQGKSQQPAAAEGRAPVSATSDGAAREKEKTKKAREELRRYKQEAEAELRAERARVEKATQEITGLKTRLDAALKEADSMSAALAAEHDKADRELRRARKDADKAQAKTDEVTEQLRKARRELSAAQTKIAKAEEKPATKKKTSATKRTPRGPRKPLPVPKGRMEDAPETLDAWLDTEGVILLIDGYNVTKAEGGFGDLQLERQRDLLVQNVNRLARKKKVTGTIVFDGNHVPPGTGKVGRGPVKPVYSRPDEIADDHIVALLEELPAAPVILVTNDRELQQRARRLGTTIATSPQLLSLIR